MLKKIISAVLVFVLAVNFSDVTFATKEEEFVLTAENAVLVESGNNGLLYSKNGEEKVHISHFNKLMTLLILAEKIENGEVAQDTIFTVSQNANATSDPQIWLNIGEKVTVSDLIKAITIGNANDAAVTIAENIALTEMDFVRIMNEKALELSLENTVFSDSTGTLENQYSTAYDVAVIASELLKFPFLEEYFTTWMDTVRNGETEVVSQNRMLKTYSGISGMKGMASAFSGQCLVVTAQRQGLSFVAVVINCPDSESRFDDGKKLLDFGFAEYVLYYPDIPPEALEDIVVRSGQEDFAKIKVNSPGGVTVNKSDLSKIQIKWGREEFLTAPIKIDQKVGEIVIFIENERFFSVDILSNSEIYETSFFFSFKKLVSNLMKL